MRGGQQAGLMLYGLLKRQVSPLGKRMDSPGVAVALYKDVIISVKEHDGDVDLERCLYAVEYLE